MTKLKQKYGVAAQCTLYIDKAKEDNDALMSKQSKMRRLIGVSLW